MFKRRKTKIIVSVGPACSGYETIGKLIEAGVDQFRFNFSHADYDKFRETISHIRAHDPNMAIMGDLKGAEIRTICPLGPVTAEKGEITYLNFNSGSGEEGFSLNYNGVERFIKKGNRILVDDGNIEFTINAVDSRRAELLSVTGGTVENRKGVYLDNSDISFPLITEQDRADIAFAVEEGMDIIAASMVRSADEILEMRKIIPEHIQLVSKIEHPAGAENIEEIARVSDMILIARGDLGVQMDLKQLPVIQKTLIAAARKEGKPVIIATQMLESMRDSLRPTRAEVTDIGSSIYESVDALMLTGETAAGRYPVETVRTLGDVIEAVEASIDYSRYRDKIKLDSGNVSEAISYSSVEAAASLNAKGIICFTTSGTTALRVAKFRPSVPIISITTNTHVSKMLSGVFGITTFITSFFDTTDDMIENSKRILKEEGIAKPGDRFVITAGVPLGVKGTTNMLKVLEI